MGSCLAKYLGVKTGREKFHGGRNQELFGSKRVMETQRIRAGNGFTKDPSETKELPKYFKELYTQRRFFKAMF